MFPRSRSALALALLPLAPLRAAPAPVPEPRPALLMSGRALQARLRRPELVVLHVAQDRAGYDQGHVPGARFVPLADLVVTRDGIPNEMPPLDALTAWARRLGLAPDRRIVVYDEGTGLHAARAFVVLDSLGLGETSALLDGQLPFWRRQDRPLETATPRWTPSTFTPTPRPEVLVDLGAVRALAGSGARLVDARPTGQFTGADASDGVPRAGHIPGAASVPWDRHLTSDDDPRLRSVAALRELYAPAGLPTAAPVVTYCRTGMSASHSYFVLRYLGHSPRLYDGSFSEWSRAADTPVATGP